ncbi:MAG: serine/threonine-protein kinase [bacterium]
MSQIQFKLPETGTIITISIRTYKVGKRIDNNQGGFSWVYSAVDVNSLTPVVLKIFKPNNRPFEEVQSQWKKEVTLFNKLRHANIVRIYDAFLYNNLFYIVLEKAWGDLNKYVQSQFFVKKLNELDTKNITLQLLSALGFIHQNSIIHKDLTIYNILVFKKTFFPAIFKISDFGISKEFGYFEPIISNTQIIHPQFKPPEFVNFGFTDMQSDLYQLGLVLLYCVTGNNPFLNKTQQEIDKIITDGIPRQIAENIKIPFGNFISILLRRHKEYRFKDTSEAINYLYQNKIV